MGVIKGSEAAIGKEGGYLDKDTYLSSGGRSGRGILPQTKEAIYALFNAYTKIKQEYLEYDAADRSAPPKYSPICDWLMLSCRTHHILKEFHEVGWNEDQKGEKVNYLLV